LVELSGKSQPLSKHPASNHKTFKQSIECGPRKDAQPDGKTKKPNKISKYHKYLNFNKLCFLPTRRAKAKEGIMLPHKNVSYLACLVFTCPKQKWLFWRAGFFSVN